jgi:hypothetical protein
MTQENTQIDEEITTTTDQCKEYQNQMEVCRIFIKINKLFKNYLLYLATSSSTQ